MAITLLLLSCGSLIAKQFWLADIVANLRVQGLIAIGVTIVAALCMKQLRIAAVLAACVAWHATWFLPTNTTVPIAAPDFSISTINVQTSNRSHDLILEEVRLLDTDVVAIVELSSALEQAWAESDLAQTYPHRLTTARDDGNFGIGLYSKQPFDSIAERDFSGIGLPSIVSDLTIHGRSLRVIATHTLPPIGDRAFSIRNHHLQQLADHVHKHQTDFPDTEVVTVGDFNLTPWSPCFTSFLNQSDLQRSTCAVNPTWFAGSNVMFGLQLDHILVSRRLTAGSTTFGTDIGSDHRAVAVSLTFRNR